MTTVQDGITWALYGTEMKDYLGITGTSEDARLELWMDAATAAADLYIDTDLSAESDQNPLAVEPDFDARPWAAIKAGVFEWVRITRTGFQQRTGVRSVKTEDLAESYSTGSSGAGLDAQAALSVACDYWHPFKDVVLL